MIIKCIQPHWPDDPQGVDREVNFYTSVLPSLSFDHPQVYFSGCDPETNERIILLEDLDRYHFSSRTHQWTPAEARQFINVYAQLHVGGAALSEHASWLFEISTERLPVDVLSLYEDLVRHEIWAPVAGLEKLYRWCLDIAPEMARLQHTVLHNDVYPPNIGLPENPTESAVLVDWEMAGYGLPEMDLAFMFLQPFHSADKLQRPAVLNQYWRCRFEMEGRLPDNESRQARQRFADTLWGLYLIKIAHKSVFNAFPGGSAPDNYWISMRPVLHEWLGRLAG